MAHIDDLIARVKDPEIRKQLRTALDELRRTRRVGLVYEDRVPETFAVPGLALSPGTLVRPRTELHEDSVYRVASLRGSDAEVQSLEGTTSKAVAQRDLWVLKAFDNPIRSILQPLTSVRAGSADRPAHQIINAENLHALQLLVEAYGGLVDCIYIDPPYNSGAKDWKYNNRYVDDKDDWRHSKWLSFMQRRLSLAKRLLKPDGVLVVTIDKHEHFHLGVLLEQEFAGYDVTSVCIVHNPRGAQGDNFSHTNEFAIFVTPERQQVIAEQSIPEDAVTVTGVVTSVGNAPIEGARIELKVAARKGAGSTGSQGRFRLSAIEGYDGDHLRNWGGESRREDARNCFYPILVEGDRIVGFGEVPPDDVHPPHHLHDGKGILEIWPIDNEGHERKWRYARQSIEGILEKLSIKYIDDVPQIFLKKTTRTHKTVWHGRRYDANTYGTKIVKKLTGIDFPYPKSVLAVRDTLNACVKNKPEALILDFFGGSGTTFHAICMLNAEDGGKRRCLIVTNNEVSENQAKELRAEGLYPGDAGYEAHGIFEAITVPRCTAVVRGTDADGNQLEGELDGRPLNAGFHENIGFFRLTYIDHDDT